MRIQRALAGKVIHLASKYPVVSITGPRQSGKTTLAKMCFPDYFFTNLEIPDVRLFAETDPRAFLAQGTAGMILDEIQNVPILFSYIQGISDESGNPGQFILTGSQNFLLAEKITQTLAGRVAIVNLLPFSMDELSLAGILPSKLFTLLFQGQYPRLYDQKIQPTDFYPSYIQTYLERDVRNILNISSLSLFRIFLGVLAGRAGQLINYSSIANQVGVNLKTIQSWLSILETSYIVYLVRPYHKNYNKRLVKSPKLYFYDTGLLCSLLGIKQENELQFHSMAGAIFENFIFNELQKLHLNRGLIPEIYFWRDNTGNEIDCIMCSGTMVNVIEIKSSTTIANDFFKWLNYYRSLAGSNNHKYVLVYAGKESQQRSSCQVLNWKSLGELMQ